MNNLENAIKGTDWSTILDNEDTEDSCCTFLNTISEIITSYTKRVKHKHIDVKTYHGLMTVCGNK